MELRSTFCGTPLYVSPEILKGEQYDERIDLWSIGILAYEMLVGDIPFEITREEELIKIVLIRLNADQRRNPLPRGTQDFDDGQGLRDAHSTAQSRGPAEDQPASGTPLPQPQGLERGLQRTRYLIALLAIFIAQSQYQAAVASR